jgi:23S rRNA (guanosine2251-2'-O)-methyltransferase
MRKTLNEELNRLSVEAFKQASKIPLVLVLDNVRSLHNVGSVFRTADAFRVEALFLCGITGKPPDREIRKTALGATESVAWRYFASTAEAVQELKDTGFRVYAIEQAEGASYLDAFLPEEGQKLAVVFGNEVHGVDQTIIDVSDGVLEIPQSGTKHSLNIAVSAGVVVWELWKKLSAGSR